MYSRQAVGLILKTRCSQFGSVFSRLQTTKSPTKDHRDIVPFGTPSQGVDVVPAGSWAKFATFQRSNGSDVAHFQDVVRTGSWSVRDAGGSRTHFDRVAADCRAVWLQRHVSVLARNRTWSSTFAESRANPAHSKDMLFVSTSPGSRTPSYGSEDRRASITLARHVVE